MKIPSISSKKLIQCLTNKLGFEIIRQKGSHIILKHQDGRIAIVPYHQGKDLSKGLLIKIIKKEIKIPIEEFVKILNLFLIIQFK